MHSVFERLGNIEVGSLQFKSVVSRMMVEAGILSQMQVAEAMVESNKIPNKVSHSGTGTSCSG